MLKQKDNREEEAAIKTTREKVDSLYQRNDSELQAIRDLIEVITDAVIIRNYSATLLIVFTFNKGSSYLNYLWRVAVMIRASESRSRGR